MALQFTFFPIDISYGNVYDKTVIYLFGRTQANEQICVIDADFEPYFYVRLRDESSRQIIIDFLKDYSVHNDEAVYAVKDVKSVTHSLLLEKINLLKISCYNQKGQNVISESLKSNKNILEIYEADMTVVQRYMFDKKIRPLTMTNVIGEREHGWVKTGNVFKAKKIWQESTDIFNSPNVLSFNIETFKPLDDFKETAIYPIMMVSLYSENFKKVISCAKFETDKDYIEFVETESDLIERFKAIVENIKPDILLGYQSDTYDLYYIALRAKKHNIKLDLGLNYFNVYSSKNIVDIAGIAHIDLHKFISGLMFPLLKTASLDLSSVACELIGKEFRLDSDFNREDLGKLSEYSLLYSSLIHSLYERLFPEISEFTKLCHMRLSVMTRSKYREIIENQLSELSVSSGMIIPNKPTYDEMQERRRPDKDGAFEPKLGFYKDIAVFDFRSFYPTLMRVYNISPETLNANCPDLIKNHSQDGNYFCSDKRGIFPTVIDSMLMRKARIALMLSTTDDKYLLARYYCLKQILSRFYYYISHQQSRWYSYGCASSIMAFGNMYMQKSIELGEKYGYNYLNSDESGIYFSVKADNSIDNFITQVNSSMPELLEIESAGFYPKGLFIITKEEMRISKNFALLSKDNSVIIKGFANILRTPCSLTHLLQKRVISLLLKEENADSALKLVKDIIRKVKENSLPMSYYVITQKLLKNIDKYEMSYPFVAAAKRMLSFGHVMSVGSNVEYVIMQGEGKLNEKVRLEQEITTSQIDVDYYITRQIIPCILPIFEMFGITKEDMLDESDQSRLEDYM